MDKEKIAKVIPLATRSGKLSPAAMVLRGAVGKRVVVNAAKRVINTHSDVIKALAKR